MTHLLWQDPPAAAVEGLLQRSAAAGQMRLQDGLAVGRIQHTPAQPQDKTWVGQLGRSSTSEHAAHGPRCCDFLWRPAAATCIQEHCSSTWCPILAACCLCPTPPPTCTKAAGPGITCSALLAHATHWAAHLRPPHVIKYSIIIHPLLVTCTPPAAPLTAGRTLKPATCH